jgi:hypothetical protein
LEEVKVNDTKRKKESYKELEQVIDNDILEEITLQKIKKDVVKQEVKPSPLKSPKKEERKSTTSIIDNEINKINQINNKDQEKLLKTFKQAFLSMNSNM